MQLEHACLVDTVLRALERAAFRGRAASSDVIVVLSQHSRSRTGRSKRKAESEAGDVIDLGAPRLLRREPPARLKPNRSARTCPPYTPNPRLYPGPRPKPKSRPKRVEARAGDGRGRRRKRAFRRVVPNPRLYRPAPPRRVSPPAVPRASWPPPAPPAKLDTASRVALRLTEQWRGVKQAARSPVQAARSPVQAARSPVWVTRSPVQAARSPGRARRPLPSPPPERKPASSEPPSRRLVVTLPVTPVEPAVPRYRPASEHFRLLSLDTDSDASKPAGRPAARARPPAMDAGARPSLSPEDCSDGNETSSAPSEFLAEFLSSIMRRQYAEALKYCRLILQYEPHNATARGFYPLLQHKVQVHQRAEGAWARGSSSEEPSAHSDKLAPLPQVMEQGADEWPGSGSGSGAGSWCGSQSSLELDSSEPRAPSDPSRSASRRSDPTDSVSGCCESSGSASRSEPDDNGNAPPPHAAPPPLAADLANDNAAPLESSSSLQRLRAQFTCSIK